MKTSFLFLLEIEIYKFFAWLGHNYGIFFNCPFEGGAMIPAQLACT